jgi:hypothetical protein
VPVVSEIPARVTFVPLDDLNGERVGFGPGSVYVEYCLLPLIGPSCYLLYRRVAPLIPGAGSAEVDLAELGRNLGLGAKIGRNSAVVKALDRLEAFRLGAWQRDARYALRLTVAPLTDRQAKRLPHLARTVHYRTVGMGADAGWVATTPSRPEPLR